MAIFVWQSLPSDSWRFLAILDFLDFAKIALNSRHPIDLLATDFTLDLFALIDLSWASDSSVWVFDMLN